MNIKLDKRTQCSCSTSSGVGNSKLSDEHDPMQDDLSFPSNTSPQEDLTPVPTSTWAFEFKPIQPQEYCLFSVE